MANAWCINAISCDWCLIQTLQQLDSSNIWVWVQFTAPNPLDDKRFDYIKYTDKCWNTCCLSWENEILIYATNWTIKNLTLTNDDANEVVNVKRSDVFWSNRKKTVVRYKTWWYPTSITDWTLAVEELVQNQYASTWYNVSWLSDWTTYYFSAFAVAQDDTIIVVQSSSITPSFVLVQTFDFQNQGALWRTWWSVWYWIPDYVSWQWRKIWTSTTTSYQWSIIPPTSIFQRTLQSIKIYFYKPNTTTSSKWSAVWITDTDHTPIIEYWRNHSWSLWRLDVSDNRQQVYDWTWEMTLEAIFESSWNVVVKISNTSTTYTYNWWNHASDYRTMRNNKTLVLEMARRNNPTNYIRKVEFVSR